MPVFNRTSLGLPKSLFSAETKRHPFNESFQDKVVFFFFFNSKLRCINWVPLPYADVANGGSFQTQKD